MSGWCGPHRTNVISNVVVISVQTLSHARRSKVTADDALCLRTMTSHSTLLWLICFIFGKTTGSVDNATYVCPDGCTCGDADGLSVRCDQYTGAFIPVSLPEMTVEFFIEGSFHFSGACVEVLRDTDFVHSPLIRLMQIEGCALNEIRPRTFQFQEHLDHLILSNNRLQRITSHAFQGLFAATRILLDNNQIQTVEEEAFVGVGKDSTGTLMSISNNPNMQDIHPRAFHGSNVKELDLSNANLTSRSLRALKPLQRKLDRLVLSSNNHPLDIGDALYRFRISTLVLEDDGLRNVSFLRDVNVRRMLSLASNPIGVVDFRQYPKLSDLKTLDLRATKCTSLDRDYFSVFRKLKRLYLSDNLLTTLSPYVQPLFQELSNGVTLDNNPFHCNCELKWFQTWLISNPRMPVRGTSCSTPWPGDMVEYGEMTCSVPSDAKIKLKTQSSDQVRLYCDYREGDPPHSQVEWSYDTSTKTMKVTTDQNEQVLLLEVNDDSIMDLNSTLSFSCKVSNTLGWTKATIDIDMNHLKANLTNYPSRKAQLNLSTQLSSFSIMYIIAVISATSSFQ